MAAQERTEAPTPRRRQQAREEGQIAVSRDLTSGLALLAVTVAARACWGSTMAKLARTSEAALRLPGPDVTDPVNLTRILRMWEGTVAQTVLPVIGAGAVTGLLVGLAQTRFLFSLKPLEPTLEKLSPLNGMKRIFSIRGLVEAIKGLLKVSLVLGMVAWVLWSRRDAFAQLPVCSTESAVELCVDLVFLMVLRCAELLVVIGVADYAYQWWEYERSLKMTRQDVMREYREMEGDPHVRARRKALRRNMLQQGISRDAPQASVVVTNPTHIAVALAYRAGLPAPRVVAKGRHRMAQRIVRMASRYNIPVVQNVAVARALYKSAQVGDFIPGQLFQAVAEILAIVYRKAQERRARQARYGLA